MSSRGDRETDAGMHLMVGFQGTTLDAELKSLIREYKIGGIILFKRNIRSPEQLKALLSDAQSFSRGALGRGILVSIDQEGGPVQRLTPPFTQLPSARDLSSGGPQAIREWTTKAATDLYRMGIHINLAPVLDIVTENNPNFMEARSLGRTPEQVAELGNLWIRVLQENGVSATAKHYPGLGRAELDPHHFAPVIRWQNDSDMNEDIHPFASAVRSGVHCVMTSHALYPALDPVWPATLSPVISDEWLRRRLRFDGVLLSDDMDMAAISEKYGWQDVVRQGILSSIDFFLLCQLQSNIGPFFEELCSAISRDATLEEAHRKSAERIRRLMDFHAAPMQAQHF